MLEFAAIESMLCDRSAYQERFRTALKNVRSWAWAPPIGPVHNVTTIKSRKSPNEVFHFPHNSNTTKNVPTALLILFSALPQSVHTQCGINPHKRIEYIELLDYENKEERRTSCTYLMVTWFHRMGHYVTALPVQITQSELYCAYQILCCDSHNKTKWRRAKNADVII